MTEYEPVFFDIETTGLNPLAQEWHGSTEYGAQVHTVCIGWIDNWRDGQPVGDAKLNHEIYYDDSEYRLLNRIAEVMDDKLREIHDNDTVPFLVSFNGRQYDHPYLGARFARYRLDGNSFNSDYKRLDMMRALGKHLDGVGRYPSEDDCLEALGIGSDDPFDGSDMPDAFAERDWDTIKTHVKEDVKEMMKLFIMTKEECFKEFYDHYSISKDPNFVEEVEP